MRRFLLLTCFALSLYGGDYLGSIYENIILKDAKKAQKSAVKLTQALQSGDIEQSRELFATLVPEWKRVQALYIAKDMSDAMKDIPRLVDTYHYGNEDLHKQIARGIAQGIKPEIALYKNSHRSINALEYLLYAKDVDDAQRAKYGAFVSGVITQRLKDIHSFYKGNKKLFMDNPTLANSAVLNGLIDSSYKLKEWRVGDTAGLSKKYKGKRDPRRAEYPLSGLSISAMEAILQLHEDVIGDREYHNFRDMVLSAGADDDIRLIDRKLGSSFAELKKLDGSFKGAEGLYDSLTGLYHGYYVSLIVTLKITSKIVDADGD